LLNVVDRLLLTLLTLDEEEVAIEERRLFGLRKSPRGLALAERLIKIPDCLFVWLIFKAVSDVAVEFCSLFSE